MVSAPCRNPFPSLNSASTSCATLPRQLIPASHQTAETSSKTLSLSVFSKSEWDLGKCDAKTHKIEVYPGDKPVKLPNRRMPLHYKQDLQDKLDVFLKKNRYPLVIARIAPRHVGAQEKRQTTPRQRLPPA